MDQLGRLSTPYRIALTLYGEADREPQDAQIAIAHVMLWRVTNNIPWDDIEDPMQFSCWNMDDPNLRRILGSMPINLTLSKCFDVAYEVYLGAHPDNTGGATHYYNPKLMKILYGKERPPWAPSMEYCTAIGSHVFLRDMKQRPIHAV
jgi:hypothetical protein